MENNQKIFTRRFSLLCLSSLLFFLSFNMIIPELYDYVFTFSGNVAKQFIILPFTLIAFLARPLSGKLVDRIGRVPIMIFGSAVACITSLLYPLVSTLLFFIALRAMHGLSTGFNPTGSSTMIADIIPKNKRGTAMGYLGFIASTGMALGPWLGSTIYNGFGYNIMFFTSSFFALLSILVIINIKETLPKSEKKPFTLASLKIQWNDIYEPRVVFPSLLFFLYCMAYGTVYNLATDFGKSVFQLNNIGYFFLLMTLASMFSRLIAGKVSDKKGRPPVVFVGLIILLIALSNLALATTLAQFYSGGILMGLAVGVLSPSIYAWVTDLSKAKHKGRAFSTMYMAMEGGIGLGAFLSAKIYNGNLSHISLAFFISMIFPLIAIILMLLYWNNYSKFAK